MLTREEFFKQKIFYKQKLSEIKHKFPSQKFEIHNWYKSDDYKNIQDYKSFLSTKLKQVLKYDERICDLSNQLLYDFYLWWQRTPKKCHYCKLPESSLQILRELPEHVNKRYPLRGKSLEIDRKLSSLPYDKIENLVLSCYWCNNAKTDTFTSDEFIGIGESIKQIWEKRLGINL